MGTRLTKRLLESGHTVKIADKRKSVTYLELWLRCDVRNSGNETKEFPASLTDEAIAPGADKIAKESQPMHSLLEVLKGSDVVVNLSAEHRDDVSPKSLYDEVNVQGSENICKVCAEPSERIKALADGKSIFVTGFIENLEGAISDSCVAVAPVRIAAGIQNKVLVAMGCGVPVVMSPLISAAIPELSDGKNCIIKDSATDIAESVVRLMSDESYRNSIAENGYRTVKENYSWNKKLDGYEDIAQN